MAVGTPDAGTTQAAGSGTDSANYADFAALLSAYEADVAAVAAGDAYGRNPVDLYNPLNCLGAEETSGPVWMQMICGAKEGDIAMMNSLNLQIAALNAGLALALSDGTVSYCTDDGSLSYSQGIYSFRGGYETDLAVLAGNSYPDGTVVAIDFGPACHAAVNIGFLSLLAKAVPQGDIDFHPEDKVTLAVREPPPWER